MHKFILGENPQAPESGGLWIIHLPPPVAIIEATLSGEKVHAKNVKGVSSMKYENSDGDIEWWEFRMYHFFITDFNLVVKKEAKQATDDLMVRVMFWFKSYLEWEDKNIDQQKYF